MPVEIKELVIRTVVAQGTAESPGADASPAAALSGGRSAEGIVQECVRQVLRILAKSEER
jgi:Family of unknown function (DUF5908)